MHENHFDSTIVSSSFQKVLLFKEFASKFIFYCATIHRRVEKRQETFFFFTSHCFKTARSSYGENSRLS